MEGQERGMSRLAKKSAWRSTSTAVVLTVYREGILEKRCRSTWRVLRSST